MSDKDLHSFLAGYTSDGLNITTPAELERVTGDTFCEQEERELERFFREVHSQILAFITNSIFGSVYELERNLLASFEANSLLDLGIGDLKNLPIVKNNFRSGNATTVERASFSKLIETLDTIRAKKMTSEILRKAYAKKFKCEPENACVFVSPKFGIYVAQCNRIRKEFQDKVERAVSAKMRDQAENPQSTFYKQIQKKETDRVEKKLRKTLESEIEEKVKEKIKEESVDSLEKTALSSFGRVLTSKKQDKFLKKVTSDIQTLKGGESSIIPLRDLLNAVDSWFTPGKTPKRCLDMWKFLDEEALMKSDDYLLVHKEDIGKLVPNSALDGNTPKEANTGDSTAFDGFKKHMFKYLFENLRLRYPLSHILTVLQSCCDQEENMTFVDILENPEFSTIINYFDSNMSPVLYAVKRHASEESEIKNFLEDISVWIPYSAPKCWKKHESLLIEMRKFCIEAEEAGTLTIPTSVISSEKELFKHEIASDSLLHGECDALEQINAVPFGCDVKEAIHWDHCFAEENGALVNFLIQNESHLSGHFIGLSNGGVLRISAHHHQSERDDDSSVFNQLRERDLCLYWIEFIKFNYSSLDLLIADLKDYSQKYDDRKNFVAWCTEALEYAPSMTMKAELLKLIIIPTIEPTELDYFCETWPSCDKQTLAHIGTLLNIPVWSQTSIRYESRQTRSIATNDSSTSGLVFTQTEQENDKQSLIPNISESMPVTTNTGGVGVEEKEKEKSLEQDMEDGACKLFIEHDILVNKFGDGKEHHESFKNMEENVRAGVKRLAGELYSEDVHFVMELIQNADDNSYEEGVCPKLCFDVTDEHILVRNNEIGFSSKNIAALCAVGASTKEGKKGYIGKKGIGFKSVFRVTQRPEIYSKGFQIAFDVTENEIGYIKPTWIPEFEPSLVEMQQGYNTMIRLPFNDVIDTEMLKSQTGDISANLLLFLRTLKEIHITHGTKERILSKKENQNVIEISETINGRTRIKKWLRVENNVPIPEKIHRTRDMEEFQNETTISLVFPLEEYNGEWHLRDQSKNAQVLPLFAYLPLKYKDNLRFIVQADFIVSSSRETINKDHMWNKWLREQIPSTFMHALTILRECTKGSWIHSLNHFIPYIPSGCERNGFLSDLPNHIGAHLASQNWLVDSDSNQRQPKELVFLSENSSLARKYFDNTILFESIGKCWIHTDIHLSSKKAKLCGVSEFTVSDAMKYFLTQREGMTIPMVSPFMIVLFDLFYGKDFMLKKELAALPWVPLLGKPWQRPDAISSQTLLVMAFNSSSIEKTNQSNILDAKIFEGLLKEEKEKMNQMLALVFPTVKHCKSLLDYVKFGMIAEYRSILADHPLVLSEDGISTCAFDVSPETLSIIKQHSTTLFSAPFQKQFASLNPTQKKELCQEIAKSILIVVNDQVIHLASHPVYLKVETKLGKLFKKEFAWEYFPTPSSSSISFCHEIGITFGPRFQLDENREFSSPGFTQILQDNLKADVKAAVTRFIFTLLTHKDKKHYLPILLSKNSPLFMKEWIYCETHKTNHAASSFYWSKCGINDLIPTCTVNSKLISKDLARSIGIKTEIQSPDLIDYIHNLYDKYEETQKEYDMVELEGTEQEFLKKIYSHLAKEVANPQNRVNHSNLLTSKPFLFMAFPSSPNYGKFYEERETYMRDSCNVLADWGNPCVFDCFPKDSYFSWLRQNSILDSPDTLTYLTYCSKAKEKIAFSDLSIQIWKLFAYFLNDYSGIDFLQYTNLFKLFPIITGFENGKIEGEWREKKGGEILYFIDKPALHALVPKIIATTSSFPIMVTPKDGVKDDAIRFVQETLGCSPLSSLRMDKTVDFDGETKEFSLVSKTNLVLSLLERFYPTTFERTPYGTTRAHRGIQEWAESFRKIVCYTCTTLKEIYTIDGTKVVSEKDAYFDANTKSLYVNASKKKLIEDAILLAFAEYLFSSLPIHFHDYLGKLNMERMEEEHVPLSKRLWKLDGKKKDYFTKPKTITIDPNQHEIQDLRTYEQLHGISPEPLGQNQKIHFEQEDAEKPELIHLPDERAAPDFPVFATPSSNSPTTGSDSTAPKNYNLIHDQSGDDAKQDPDGKTPKETKKSDSQNVPKDSRPPGNFNESNRGTSSGSGGTGTGTGNGSVNRSGSGISEPSIAAGAHSSSGLGHWVDNQAVEMITEESKEWLLSAEVAGLYSDSNSKERSFHAEELVYRQLLKDGYAVEWVNESGETGKPYDLLVGSDYYIEVKSTTNEVNNSPFYMSYAELQYAMAVEKYDIIRIFSCTSKNPKCFIVTDVAEKIRTKQLQTCVQMNFARS